MAEALGELTRPTPTGPRSLASSIRLQMRKVSWFSARNASPSGLWPLMLPLFHSTHVLWSSIGLQLTIRLCPCHFISRFLAPDRLESMLFTTGLQSPGIPETHRLPLYSGFSEEDHVLVPCRFPSLNQVRRMEIWSDLLLSCDNTGMISTRRDCLECRGLRKYSK